jgi:hypothetical protein
MLERIDHRAVIAAVAGSLDYDVAGETEMISQGIQLLPGRVAGRVFALWCIGKLGTGPEYMTVRVHRACRHLEPGF